MIRVVQRGHFNPDLGSKETEKKSDFAFTANMMHSFLDSLKQTLEAFLQGWGANFW